MTKLFSFRTICSSLLLKSGLAILIIVVGVSSSGCDYVTELQDGKQQGQALFPELPQGSYFGEIALVGKRHGAVERFPLLVVVQQAGRLSWSVGDYMVKDIENSYSGVANLLMPFKLEITDGMVELAWNKPQCAPGEQCSPERGSISRWQGDVIWRGASGKKKSITVFKDNVGRIGSWFLKPLNDEPAREQKEKAGSELVSEPFQPATLEYPVAEKSNSKASVPGSSPALPSTTGDISPAVRRFDLSVNLRESGFCTLPESELSDLIGKLHSERKELAKQLYYTAKATPAGRLVWLSRLLLSQEGEKIRPVAEVAAAPVIDSEIEAEKKRLAALQALGIQ